MEFSQEKGFEKHQFYSDIKLTSSRLGFDATITAKAESLETAKIVAHVYFGRMIDILSLKNNISIQLTGNKLSNTEKFSSTRRVLTVQEIKAAFNMARKFEIEEPRLLRAIGWYSKGNQSQNTFDQFLAYWNVLEILSNHYHTKTTRTEKGTINRIYQSFIDYFGEIDTWDLPEKWIDTMYESRNKIFHGGEDTTLETVKRISEQIPLLTYTSKRLVDSIINSKYEENDFIRFQF